MRPANPSTRCKHQTATVGSNPILSASEPANFLSGHACVAHNGHLMGSSARKTTTMRRTIRLQIRSVRALSARFLRAMIVEWLFPMHLDKALTCVQRMPRPLPR